MCSAGIAKADPIMVCGRVNFHKTTGNDGVSGSKAHLKLMSTFSEVFEASADDAVLRAVGGANCGLFLLSLNGFENEMLGWPTFPS